MNRFKSPSILFHIPFWVGIILVSFSTGMMGKGLWDVTVLEAQMQGEKTGATAVRLLVAPLKQLTLENI